MLFTELKMVFDAKDQLEGQMSMFSDVPIGYHKYKVNYQVVACFGKTREHIGYGSEEIIAKTPKEAETIVKKKLRQQQSNLYPIHVQMSLMV